MADKRMESAFEGLSMNEDGDKLIIGVDFGTTYSGVAYLFTGIEKPEPIPITEWPGAKGANRPKVPTIIRYEKDSPQTFTWGYNLAHSTFDGKIEGIKLLLDPDQPKPLYVPQSNTRAELKRLGKPPIDVAADYISALYKHALSKIEAAWPQDYLQMLQKKFVLTVPALWSDKAKDITMRAAKKAGIYPITLIKEPEAAAQYTLYSLKDKALSVGDAFVLCDAGGGTVDLISYEITKIEPLELRELVKGTGGLAGSLMINKRFEEAIKYAVGEDQYLPLRKHKSYRIAMQYFDESVKPAFNPFDQSGDDVYYVNFPMAGLEDDPANNISSNCFNVTREILEGIYQPLIKDINGLVKEQVDSVRIKRMEEHHAKGKEIKAIFLVGGFGSSIYLRQSLQTLHPDIQIIQPTHAWSAIVRGAVLSQAPREAVVTSTVAPRHYGVSATALWTDDDAAQPQIWDSFIERHRVLKMTWYIYASEDLQREQRVSFLFHRSLEDNYGQDQLIFRDELIQSEAIMAPKYPRPETTTVNCVVTADFRGVPKENFKRCFAKDGRPYYQVHYSLNITFDSAMMRFSSEMNGKEMGVVEAKYD